MDEKEYVRRADEALREAERAYRRGDYETFDKWQIKIRDLETQYWEMKDKPKLGGLTDAMTDIQTKISQMQKDIAENTERVVLSILNGTGCVICGDLAGHVEFGEVELEVRDDWLEFNNRSIRMTRRVRPLCAPHWPHDKDVIVAYVA